MQFPEYEDIAGWEALFAAIPPDVRGAIFDNAKTCCVQCALRAVPTTWAVVTYYTMKENVLRSFSGP